MNKITLPELQARAAELKRNIEAAQLRLISNPNDSTAERDIKHYRQDHQLVLGQIEGLKLYEQEQAHARLTEEEEAERRRLLDLQTHYDETLDESVKAAKKADYHLNGLCRAFAQLGACTPSSSAFHAILNARFRSRRQLITMALLNAGVIEPMDPGDARRWASHSFLQTEMERIRQARELVDNLVPLDKAREKVTLG